MANPFTPSWGGGGGSIYRQGLSQSQGLGPSMSMMNQQRMGQQTGNVVRDWMQRRQMPGNRYGQIRQMGGNTGFWNPNAPRGHGAPMDPNATQGPFGPVGDIYGSVQDQYKKAGIPETGMPAYPGRPPAGKPGYGEGTGSNSRTSSDWKRRHPEDMGPIGPSPRMDGNMGMPFRPRPDMATTQGGPINDPRWSNGTWGTRPTPQIDPNNARQAMSSLGRAQMQPQMQPQDPRAQLMMQNMGQQRQQVMQRMNPYLDR